MRIRQRSCTLQVDNISSRKRAVHCGQYLARADLNINDEDDRRIHHPPLTSYTSTPESSPTENYKQSRRSDWQKRNENCELKFYEFPCNLHACMSSPFLSSNDHRSLVSNFLNLDNVIVQETKTSLNFLQTVFSINANNHIMYYTLLNGSNNDLFSQIDVSDTDINDEQISILKDLLLKHSSCFRPTPGRTALVQHYIDTGNT